jgi:hypothetical protein
MTHAPLDLSAPQILMRTLLMVFALALMAAPSAAEEAQSVEGEIARVIRVAHEGAPYRTWDDLRVAMPRTVQWHLAPPDRRDAAVVRRSGWIASSGRQAGVAACGPALGPDLLTLRMATGEEDAAADPVLNMLRASGVDLQRMRTTTPDHEVYAEDGQWSEVWFSREVSCTPEGAAAARGCSVSYIINVRPHYASAPQTQECRAP